MTTSIKNNKKVSIIRSAAMMLTVALAIGASAFTTAHKSLMKINKNAEGKIISVTASYFRLPGNASTSTDMNASHYVFSDGARADCTTGTNDICKSEWTTANAPTDGQSPNDAGSPSFVSDLSNKGIYNGQ